MVRWPRRRQRDDHEREGAAPFLVTVATAYSESEHSANDVLLDYGHARTLVERMWDYDLATLHEQALSKRDPQGRSRREYRGLKTFDARESVLGLIVLRLVKKPPSLGENALNHAVEGVGCKHEGCKQPITGAPCVGGCKWDETGEGREIADRHNGLIELWKLVLAWGVSPTEVFAAVGVEKVREQKEALTKMLFDRARKLDFVRPVEKPAPAPPADQPRGDQIPPGNIH